MYSKNLEMVEGALLAIKDVCFYKPDFDDGLALAEAERSLIELKERVIINEQLYPRTFNKKKKRTIYRSTEI